MSQRVDTISWVTATLLISGRFLPLRPLRFFPLQNMLKNQQSIGKTNQVFTEIWNKKHILI